MKKFVFSVASRVTDQLQIKPSGSVDENEPKSGYLGLTAHALLSIQNFLLLLYLLHREVSCCFGIRTELETEPLKNFQVSKAPAVTAEKIPLKVGSQI